MFPSFTDSLTWCAWPQATAAKLRRALEIVWQLRVGFVKTQGFTTFDSVAHILVILDFMSHQAWCRWGGPPFNSTPIMSAHA